MECKGKERRECRGKERRECRGKERGREGRGKERGRRVEGKRGREMRMPPSNQTDGGMSVGVVTDGESPADLSRVRIIEGVQV